MKKRISIAIIALLNVSVCTPTMKAEEHEEIREEALAPTRSFVSKYRFAIAAAGAAICLVGALTYTKFFNTTRKPDNDDDSTVPHKEPKFSDEEVTAFTTVINPL